MRLRAAILLIVAAPLAGCGDVYHLRKAQSAYIMAKRAYDARCVTIDAPAAPQDCLEEYGRIRSYQAELDSFLSAYLDGPIPDQMKAELRALPSKFLPTPTPTPAVR